MEDTYKGESPSKKFARFSFWTAVASELGKTRFYNGKHLVLASREGGDVSVLLGMGVQPKNIIPVDLNPKAALAAQDKFPEVQVIVGDVADIAKEYKRELVSAFLDFCAPMDSRIIKKVGEVCNHGMANDSVIGCAFLNGREKDVKVIDWLSERRVQFDELLKNMHKMPDDKVILAYNNIFGKLDQYAGPITLRTLARMPLKLLQENADDVRNHLESRATEVAFLLRTQYLSEVLMNIGAPFKCAPYARAHISYMSNTRYAKGVPMFIYLGKVWRGLPGTSEEKFKRKFLAHMAKEPVPLMRQCDMTEGRLRALILRMSDSSTDPVEGNPHVNEYLHMLFNIPKHTISAWKAHRTMGTYEKEII